MQSLNTIMIHDLIIRIGCWDLTLKKLGPTNHQINDISSTLSVTLNKKTYYINLGYLNQNISVPQISKARSLMLGASGRTTHPSKKEKKPETDADMTETEKLSGQGLRANVLPLPASTINRVLLEFIERQCKSKY